MQNKILDNLSPRFSFSLFSFLLGTLTFYIYRDYLLLDKLFLFKDIGSDTVNVFYPRLVYIADYLRTEGWVGWSFNQGMGQVIPSGRLGNPFEWILFALGSGKLAYGIAYIEMLKVILGGIFFYLYLRLLSSNLYVCLVGGLLFAFSGFMILGGTWYVFSAQAVYVALMLYAIERYLCYQDWRLVPVAVALIGAGFSFDLYTTAVFFLLYAAFRYCDCNGFRPKALAGFILRLAGWGSLGVLVSAVFIASVVQQMMLSQRVMGDGSLVGLLQSQPVFSFANEASNFSAIMRSFSSNMIGVGSNYQGAQNYLEAPIFYAGLVSLLLAPQVFIFLTRRQCYLYGGFALLFALPVVFPYFRYAFWLFSGDYYRIFSLFIVLLVLLFSLKGLSHIIKEKRLNWRLLLITLAVLLVALFYPYELSGRYSGVEADPALLSLTAGLLVIYVLLIVGMSCEKHRNTAAIIFVVVLSAELIITASMTVNDRPAISSEEFRSRVGYNDYSVDAVNFLKKNDSGFYRIEKTYASGSTIHTSLNDSRVQDYWGTSSYHSFNLGSYVDFLTAVGLVTEVTNRTGQRWLSGLKQRSILLSFASVKYLLVKNPKVFKRYSSMGFRKIGQVGDVIVMRNRLVLPFGFTYDAYMQSAEFLVLDAWQKDAALIKTVVLDVGAEEVVGTRLKRLKNGIAKKFKTQEFIADIQARRSQAFKVDRFSQNEISGSIALKQERMLFFSIPYEKGWRAEVDGMPVELLRVNVGFTGLMLPSGKHTVTLSYQPPYLFVSGIFSVMGLLIFMLCLWKVPHKVVSQNDLSKAGFTAGS